MSISEHERQVLATIEDDLASSGPKLTAMLTIFTRLTAGEAMPARERVSRLFCLPPTADQAVNGAPPVNQPNRLRRAVSRLMRQSAWLVWLAVVIGLITSALLFEHGAGKRACSVTQTAACQQVSAPQGPRAPGRPG